MDCSEHDTAHCALMTEAIIAISAKDCPSRLTIFPNLNPKKKDDNEIRTEG